MGCVCSKVKGGDSKKDSKVAYSPVKRDKNTKGKKKPEGKKYQKLGADFDDHEDECAEDQAGETEDANVTKEGGYSLLMTAHDEDEDVSFNASEIKDTEEQSTKDQVQKSKDDGIGLTDSTKENGNVVSVTRDSKDNVVNVEVVKPNAETKDTNAVVDSDTQNDLFITEDNDNKDDTCVSQNTDLVITERSETDNAEINSVAELGSADAQKVVKKIDTGNDETPESKISIKNADAVTPRTCVENPELQPTNISKEDDDVDDADITEDVDNTEIQPLLIETADADDHNKTKNVNGNEQENPDSSRAETEDTVVRTDQDDTVGADLSKDLHKLDESIPNSVSETDEESNSDEDAKEPLLVATENDHDKMHHREAVECQTDDKRDTAIEVNSNEEQDISENDTESQSLLSPVDVEMQPIPSAEHLLNGASSDSEEKVDHIQNGDSKMNSENEENSLQFQFPPHDNQAITITEKGTTIMSPKKVHFEDENDNLSPQFSPTSVMNDNHFQEAELTFEKAKYVIHAAMHYLKTCDNYTSDKACAVMKKLSVASCVISSLKSETRTHLASYLVQTGFAELFVKITRTLLTDDSSTTQPEDSLKVMKGTCTNFSTGNEFEPLVCELARHGAIDLLLHELDEYFPTTSDYKLLHVVHTLNILSNCVRCSDGHIRESYRNANAVSILTKYLKSNEIKLKLESLSILAYIVDDTECDLLTNIEGLFVCLIDTLQEAVTADDFYVHYNIAGEPCGDGVYGLIDTLNRLVINDSCKRQVVDQDGIPIMIQILQIQSADAQDSQLAALEALWKIAFIEKHQQILIQHILDGNVVPILTVMQTSPSLSIRDASTGLLWKLGLVDITVSNQTNGDSGDLEQIMLSYEKDDFRDAKKLRDILLAAGFKVWMDLNKGDGNMITSMVDALHNSAVVLLCISLKYRESVHCQTEATYAYESHKPVIPLLIEEQYTGDGWLGELTSTTKQLNAYSDEALEEDIEELIDELVECGCI